jgi:sulfatase modifying factor 1
MWCNSHRTRSRLESIPRLLVSGVVSTVVLSACGARSSLLTDTDAPGMGGTGGSVVTSSSGGQSSSGGGHGDVGGAGGGVGGCDPSLPGPALVEIPAPGGGHFCIDSTEVTNAHYATWLASSPEVKNQPAVCAWNDTFIPAAGWPAPSGKENEPIRRVDWCDAFAYCAAAGKHLCGKIGGGPVVYDDKLGDPMQSQWLDACTAGGTRDFPYGSTYQAQVCNDGHFGTGEPISVGQAKGCEGGYPGLFDMVGNVGEWVDSCDGTKGELDSCLSFGGSSFDAGDPPQCMKRYGFAREATASIIGIRCCRD